MLPVGLIVTYVALYVAWPLATAWVSGLLLGSTSIVQSVTDNYLGIASTIPVPMMPQLSIIGALDVAGVCAVLIIGAIILRKNAPLPLWVLANVLILMLTALWAFFQGTVAYDGTTFMLLLERTSLVMILCSPIFAVVVSALLPFSPLERAAMLALLVILDFVMSLLRIAAFPLILTHVGMIAEANLYLFFGPLIDVVYFIVVYSACVVALSRRIAKDEQAWEWL